MGKCYKYGIAGHIAKFCRANMQNKKSQICKFVNNTEKKDMYVTKENFSVNLCQHRRSLYQPE